LNKIKAEPTGLHERLSEFDEYAGDYNAGMENPIKRLLGSSADDYIDVKAKWLIRYLEKDNRGLPDKPMRMLDFGCGLGVLLRAVHRRGFKGSLHGCDVSEQMLQRAEKMVGSIADFTLISENEVPFQDDTFDVVVASSVLHHIPSADRDRYYKELIRILAPGGALVVFEHNPRNPLVRWVVSRTPIDKNAVLLDSSEVQQAFKHFQMLNVDCQYILFMPPRFKCMQSLERHLIQVPLGGQYAVSGLKPPIR